MKRIKIGSRVLGEGKPCFIIAEAGVNHNGKLALAKKLVDRAAEAGADAIKFQTFKAEDVATAKAGMAPYQKKNLRSGISQRKMLKKYELPLADFAKLKKHCSRKRIIFLTTPHSNGGLLDFVNSLVPAFKIGSGDLTNHPFLEKAAHKGKPIILSTGMATMKEVKEALRAIYRTGNKKVVALHCTTNYPCPFEEVNLNAMKVMQRELDCLVGYSDHTMGITVPVMAAALNAAVIEKHFTLDKTLPGPDHRASLEPRELKEMVEGIRNVAVAMGRFEKKPTKSERLIFKGVRKSIVAAADIAKGSRITSAMLVAKRPAVGISPAQTKKVIGKGTARNIKEDSPIRWSDLK